MQPPALELNPETVALRDKSLSEVVTLVHQCRQPHIDLSTFHLDDKAIPELIPLLTLHPTITHVTLGDMSALTKEGLILLRELLSKNETLSTVEVTGTPNQNTVQALLRGSTKAKVHYEVMVDTSQCSKKYQKKVEETKQPIENLKNIQADKRENAEKNSKHNQNRIITGRLPDELLLLILSDPTLTPKDILNTSRVSKTFYRLTQDEYLWKQFCLGYYPTLNTSFPKPKDSTWLKHFKMLREKQQEQQIKNTEAFFKKSDLSEFIVFRTAEGKVDWASTYAQLKFSKNPQEAQKEKNQYLIKAAELNSVLIVFYLLKDNADPNIKHSRGWGHTALILSAVKGHIDCIKLLLRHNKIDPNIKNYVGETALLSAAQRGKTDCLKLLLQHKDTDPNIKNTSGSTALIMAVRSGRTNCLELLLQYNKTNPNIKNNWGDTALISAAINGHIDYLKLLLQHNKTNPNIKNKKNETALDCAKTPEIKALLQEAMRKYANSSTTESQPAAAQLTLGFPAAQSLPPSQASQTSSTKQSPTQTL